MSYPRNAGTPPRISIGPVVQISDGAVQTSGVSITVVPQGGSAAAGLGTTSYENGVVLYAPTQAETNYDAFVVIAYKTGCIPASVNVVTSQSSTAGYGALDWSKLTGQSTTQTLSGTTIKTATDVETDTQDIQSRLPTALVSGRMDASVGAYQSGMTPLQPTVAGRTLDVSAGGEAGIDWANIGSPTTAVAFTGSTISTSQVVASVTNRVTANTDQWGGVAVTGMPMPTYTQPTGFLAATFPATVASTTNITTVGAVSGSVGSINGVTFPTNFALLAINSSGHISRVVLVDTTTTNSDMRGTDGAALATHWTATRAGYLDSVLIAANSNQRTVQVTGSQHVAADIHELQAGVITAGDFAAGAIDANALAADAASEIATAVRTNLATELARIDVAIGSRATQASVDTLTTYVDTEVAAIKAKTDNLPASPAAVGDIPTAVAIATQVDTRLTASHGAGSWAVGGSGSGAYTLTVTVNDGTSPLQNATVRMVEGVNAFTGQTNASGVVAFSLDAATYSVAITKDGYSFTPTTKVVSATGSHTYSMTQITPAIPAAAGLSTGTMVAYGTTGLPLQGVVVTVQQLQGKAVDGSAYDGDAFTLTSNAQGTISHNGFVRGATYSIRRGVRGEAKSFVVPDAASFDLAEILGRD